MSIILTDESMVQTDQYFPHFIVDIDLPFENSKKHPIFHLVICFRGLLITVQQTL
jgi:hypothetical protein